MNAKSTENDAGVRGGVNRTQALLCDAYRELGVCTVSFDESGPNIGKWFIGWVEEELGSLTTVVRGLMGYSTLVTHEGTLNALACEGCRHFEPLGYIGKDFERSVYDVESDRIVALSVKVLFDHMWRPHSIYVVKERSSQDIEQVIKISFCFTSVCIDGLLGFKVVFV